jgi:signal transduction histidine kinase
VCKTLQANAENKQIRLTNFIPEDACVYADKNSIETVLRNLIGNAIKFTNEGGEIKVLAQQSNEEVIVEVKDNGIGIPEELQHRLFSITEQVSQNGTKNEMGTGLGLVLCSELIKHNNGKIWFESTVAVGSSFFFSLPIKN